MSTIDEQTEIWLGQRASIWAHRGYVVRGESVLCTCRGDATSVLYKSFADADSLIEVEGGNGEL